MDEKRCLKFTGYLYLPKDASYKELRGCTAYTSGRIEIFDEHNKKTGKKMVGFVTLGQMMNAIETAFRKRVLKKIPSKEKK